MAREVRPLSAAESNTEYMQRYYRTFNMHFDTLVSIGAVDGAYPISYGGSCTGYAQSDGEIAFREGPKLGYGAALSADTVYLVSSSASDTNVYRVMGLDATGAYQETNVTATGTTPVALSGTWNHIQRCVTTAVSNVGTVYTSTDAAAIPTTIGDQIQTVMLPGEGYAINPLSIVPTGQLITLNAFDFSQDVNQSSLIKIFANRQGSDIINFKFYGGKSDQFTQRFHTPLRFFEGDKFFITVTASGGTSSKASFGMNGNVWDTTNLTSNRWGIEELMREYS